MEFLKINSLENLNIKRVLERGTGKIIYQDDKSIFILDEVSKAYMLACDDTTDGMNILEKYGTIDITLFFTSNKELGNKGFVKYGFDEKIECYQMADLKQEVPEHSGDLAFREATMDDYPFISAEYDRLSEEELKEVISRHNIILGYTDEGIVGFIGEHLEGSIGLLYILPKFRRRGYASELEKEMSRRTLAKGFIPFGQVEVDNEASIKLQESMGLTKSENTVMWMWKEK